MGFLDKDKITAADIFRQAFSYVASKYNQSRNILTPASPYTQILQVVSNIAELIFIYIENSLSELNILTARNEQNIKGMARLTGHDAFRGFASIGRIKMRIKPGADGEFDGDYFTIPNYSRLISLNNNLIYMLLLETNVVRIRKGDTSYIEGQIIQGEIEEQSIISDGTPFFSFSAVTKDTLDHDYCKVFVNGELYNKVESLYDMTRGDKSCVVKTGINGGLDIYFGNENFGVIPPEGSKITVEYMVTAGSAGNITANNDVILSWQDPGYDKFGNEVDLNETLEVGIMMAPALGSDKEEPAFTKLIAPYASKSFVLANPDNYIYYLKRFNYFSQVDAYTTFDDEYLDDDNVIYLYLVPDIRKKLTSNTNFFTIPEEEFVLTQQEINSIKRTINESGSQYTSNELKFIQPTIRRYNLTIVLGYFDKFNEDEIRSNIISKLNDYFLEVRRRDKIPKSDIISIIEKVDGVDSVNVFFSSQRNEEAIRNGYYTKKIYGYDPIKKRRELLEERKITLSDGEDPSLGIDEFGDIVIGERELPIIRGGWADRNGNNILEHPNNNSLSSVNIYFKNKVGYDIYNSINNEKRKNLK
jgi:hypothetical protein